MPSVDITAERTGIACRIVSQRAAAIVIATGVMERVEHAVTGEPIDRERWFYLPREHVEVTDGGVRLPEWLAVDRGLL